MRPIRTGDRGTEVLDVQQRLLALGGEIDAEEAGAAWFGAATEEAVRWFQRERGLPADGMVGPDTWSQLVEAGYALGDRTLYLRQPYFRGDDVRTLQRMLNSLGFDTGREDGILGEATDHAIREFQRNIGRETDGIVGRDTLSAIERLRPPVEGPSRAIVREEETVRSMDAALAGSVVAIDPAALAEAEPDVRTATEVVTHEIAAALEARGALPVILDADGTLPGDRARRANELGAAVCLSVRPDPEATAWTCFHFGTEGTHSPAGRRLAELIREQLDERFGAAVVDHRSVAILRETRMPAVQIEPPAAGKALGDADLRRALAEAVASGVERFLRAALPATS